LNEEKSSVETWSYVARTNSSRDTLESYLPLILSGAGALGVAPFAVMRFMAGDWLIAIMDTIIVVGFVALGTTVYLTRRVRFASIAISILCVTGVVATVYLRGPQQVYWAYPALMAAFYLIKPREAILLALATLAALIPKLVPSSSSFHTMTILISIIVTCVFAYGFAVANSRQHNQLINMATRDSLTGAGNRRALEIKLAEVLAAFKRNRLPVSLILLDIDHFKKVNDLHGHATGDLILQRITEIVNLRIRVTDSMYRIGGEEFVVVVDGQDIQGAEYLAEQLRTLVEVNELVPDRAVTISLGVAELQADETSSDWLHRADGALYQAKRSGRNATSVAR
jgi:diguanylate cyclase (GGDEF)-like protein